MTSETRWERIGSVEDHTSLYRIPVPGGWIYRYAAVEPALVFVPKPSGLEYRAALEGASCAPVCLHGL